MWQQVSKNRKLGLIILVGSEGKPAGKYPNELMRKWGTDEQEEIYLLDFCLIFFFVKL